MADENVISGLIRKRNEIVARIANLREAIKQGVADLDAIDASLQIFEPDIHLSPSRRDVVPAPLQAFRGEITRSVLTLLRKAEAPMTMPEIAKQRAAIIQGHLCEIVAANTIPIPSIAMLGANPRMDKSRTVSVGGETMIYSTEKVWSAAEKEQISSEAKRIYVVGYIAYTDKIGAPWETGFCREYWSDVIETGDGSDKPSATGNFFFPVNGKAHNFDRRRKE